MEQFFENQAQQDDRANNHREGRRIDVMAEAKRNREQVLKNLEEKHGQVRAEKEN